MNTYQRAINGKQVLAEETIETKEEQKQQQNEVSIQAKNSWLLYPVTIEYKNELQKEFNKLIEYAMFCAEKGDNERAAINLIRAKTIKEKL